MPEHFSLGDPFPDIHHALFRMRLARAPDTQRFEEEETDPSVSQMSVQSHRAEEIAAWFQGQHKLFLAKDPPEIA